MTVVVDCRVVVDADGCCVSAIVVCFEWPTLSVVKFLYTYPPQGAKPRT